LRNSHLLWATPYIGSSFHGFQVFNMYIIEKGLSYQRLILVVQKKSDCPVLKIGLSGFCGFKPPGQNLLLHLFSHLSLSRTTVRAIPRPLLVIPWFLRGILEFLGEINSLRIDVSVPPIGFSSSQGIFT
jgi:hypothetical protein